MQYRAFGKAKKEVSVLGFGCMRLPVVDGDSKKIDKPKATEMLRYAYDHGVNYYDTAYPYHGGESERFVGEFLKNEGIREDIYLATKLPSWLINSEGDFDRLFDEQLAKLQTDYVDYYLVHALNEENWKKVTANGVFEWAEKQIADGRIRELGFSFHDEYPVFEKITDAYDWSFTQIQYNYMDIERQAGLKGLKYAADKGLSVIIMEPLMGGRLATPPTNVQYAFNQMDKKRTPVSWALHWLWDQTEVTTILSGMSTMDHVIENVELACEAEIGSFTQEEHDLMARVRDEFNKRALIPCTNCQYCLPCTVDLQIPEIFGVFNHAVMYEDLEATRGWYSSWDAEKMASACIDCDACEPKCPQNITISDWMVKVAAVMENGASIDSI
jgi:uncharacterized protein